MEANNLKICYGNCGRTRAATTFLDTHSQQEAADLAIFTEVIQYEITDRDHADVNVVDSGDAHAASIKMESMQFVHTLAMPCDVLSTAVVNWNNLTVAIYAVYLTRNRAIISGERFRRIISRLFRTAANLEGVDAVLIAGDFNAYHPSWSSENCNDYYKTRRGEFIHQQLQPLDLYVLNNLSRGFNPTWARGDTYTVNDLFIGCSVMNQSLLPIQHEMLNGSDHRLMTLGFDAQVATELVQRRQRQEAN